jgi:hypothetical protein
MAIKRFKAYVSEEASGSRAVDSKVEGDKLEPRAEGEKDFKAKHKIQSTMHPVAGDHQFNGDRAEITEAKLKEDECECEEGDDECECPEEDDKEPEGELEEYKFGVEGEELSEGKVVDQLKDIVSKKSAKKVKFGNGKSEEIDMTTAAALVNMLEKLKPANKAKAEKMLEKSPEGMFQLLDVAFGGK